MIDEIHLKCIIERKDKEMSRNPSHCYSNELSLYQISGSCFNVCRKGFEHVSCAYCSPVFRVDADCISPDVKNSIHVGDRILEINGTPIHNVPLDEVLFTTLSPTHCY